MGCRGGAPERVRVDLGVAEEVGDALQGDLHVLELDDDDEEEGEREAKHREEREARDHLVEVEVEVRRARLGSGSGGDGWRSGGDRVEMRAHRGRVELVARERVDGEGDARDEEWLAAEDHAEGGADGALRPDDRELARAHLVRVRVAVRVAVRVNGQGQG
eukprot:scaffold26547_cov59-Phaeocystis_antarctica.AAC.1